jgi:hypothetical protein
MQLDERPYVKVTFDSLAITQGNHATRNGSTQFGWDGYKAKFLVEASGKTPAFHVVAHGFCDVEQQGLNNGSTHRLWPFLFGEKTTIDCVVSTDLPDGDLPPNIPLSLTVDYDDIFEHHHSTTFCEIAVTLQGEGVPRRDAKGTLKCPDYKHIMN